MSTKAVRATTIAAVAAFALSGVVLTASAARRPSLRTRAAPRAVRCTTSIPAPARRSPTEP